MTDDMRKDRAMGAIMGTLIGDALGMGCHWYYDIEAQVRDYGDWISDYHDSKPERDPLYAEDVIASGKADFVALARGLLYEPRWAWRAAEELGAEAPYPPQYIRAHPKNWPNAFPGRSET